MKRLDPAIRASVVSRLREQRLAGQLTSAEVRTVAAGLGVGQSTLWRWLSQGVGREDGPGEEGDGPGGVTRRGYVLTEDDVDAFYDWRGNVAAVHRARVAAGAPGLPPLRTLQRAFHRS